MYILIAINPTSRGTSSGAQTPENRMMKVNCNFILGLMIAIPPFGILFTILQGFKVLKS